jgi:integrase
MLVNKAVKRGKFMKKAILFGEFILQHYLPFYTAKKPKDFKNEMYKIKILTDSCIANMRINKVSSNDISMFLLNLQHSRGISKSTANRYRSRLSAIFNYAVDEGLILVNPIRKVKQHSEKSRGRALSKLEVDKLLMECRASRNKELYLITVLAVNAGMRKREILSLKVSDINLAEKKIILRAEHTKNGESRLVPLNSTVINLLKPYLKAIKREQVFLSCDIRSAYNYAMKRAGIIDAHFHDLRRTFATHLKDKGIPIHTMTKLLGHSSIAMTERYLATHDKILLDSVAKISFI